MLKQLWNVFLDFFQDPFHKKALQKASEDLIGYKTLVEVLQEEIHTHEKTQVSLKCDLVRADYERTEYRRRWLIYEKALYIHGGIKLTHEELKRLYDELMPALDPQGRKLFVTAESILGNFDEMEFPYEANTGYFEHPEKGSEREFQALLVQYADKLGQPAKPRWEVVQSNGGYEKCVDWSIDKTTWEYQEFEKKLYTRVLTAYFGGGYPFFV